MEPTKGSPDPVETAAHFSTEIESDSAAWEEIEAGRFMPRRIRGSFRGRALG
jgi:hypothetical protein